MNSNYFPRQIAKLTPLLFSLSFIPVSHADLTKVQTVNDKQANAIHSQENKAALIAKLSQINYINAQFSQIVVNDAGDVIQEGKGQIAISKPDFVNWHTTEPDETLIVSDGKDLWFYDPFIEQASVYSFDKSIANTPVLLLTNEDPALWDSYQVSQHQKNSYIIHSLDTESQVKSLELTFEEDQLSQLSILDSTGQLSHIRLLNVDFTTAPDPSLFEFVAPEGVVIDDQR